MRGRKTMSDERILEIMEQMHPQRSSKNTHFRAWKSGKRWLYASSLVLLAGGAYETLQVPQAYADSAVVTAVGTTTPTSGASSGGSSQSAGSSASASNSTVATSTSTTSTSAQSTSTTSSVTSPSATSTTSSVTSPSATSSTSSASVVASSNIAQSSSALPGNGTVSASYEVDTTTTGRENFTVTGDTNEANTTQPVTGTLVDTTTGTTVASASSTAQVNAQGLAQGSLLFSYASSVVNSGDMLQANMLFGDPTPAAASTTAVQTSLSVASAPDTTSSIISAGSTVGNSTAVTVVAPTVVTNEASAAAAAAQSNAYAYVTTWSGLASAYTNQQIQFIQIGSNISAASNATASDFGVRGTSVIIDGGGYTVNMGNTQFLLGGSTNNAGAVTLPGASYGPMTNGAYNSQVGITASAMASSYSSAYSLASSMIRASLQLVRLRWRAITRRLP